jgi:ABC-type multidrug transport system ATPase subunit
LLLLPFLAAFYLYSNYKRRKNIRRFGDPTLLAQLMPDVSKYRPDVKFWIIFVAIGLFSVLLARPQFGSKLETVKRKGVEVIIALDISNSMLAQDVQPSRLEKAKRLISRLVDELDNDKVGMIVFAGDAFTQLPITSDYISAKMFLESISPSLISKQGTAIGEAINLAARSFTPQEGVGRAIIVITDGENKMLVEDSLNRIEDILSRKPLPEAEKEQNIKDYSIALQNVSFRYENAGRDALHQINLDIKEGEHVAFVGPSGGGKTTLASLIARFYDTTEGKVCIGGVDVKEIPSVQLMDMVSFVFQDSKLLKMSIYDNVRMGKKDATREEVMEALKNAQCEDIIAKLPNGVDTVIGSQGTYVSGGEAQRLSIARAMLKNAPILILDEATAFADPDNEAKVQKAFTKLSAGKTVIMIAHRLSSVVDADRICVLKDGGIVEQGTHEALLTQGGLYAHMWEEYNKSVSWKVGKGEK